MPPTVPSVVYPSVDEAKELVAELCRAFYSLGWVSGTGGGVSLRAAGDRIVMAPSGVQKERMHASDMFVLDGAGAVVASPSGASKLSECAPLFMAAYELRGAGAVLHSHALEVVLATLLDESSSVVSLTQLEMLKGLKGFGYYDTLDIPVVENTARESELTGELREAMAAYPRSPAVLVRRHGVYVWGDTWASAKTQAEVRSRATFVGESSRLTAPQCLHFLLSAAVEARKMGVRLDVPSGVAPSRVYPNGAPRWVPPSVAASPT